jgi:hypothetical protein
MTTTISRFARSQSEIHNPQSAIDKGANPMWYNNRNVIATHAKDGERQAWAIISNAPPGWLRIRPTSADGVSNLLTMLSIACANNRLVDVYIDGSDITQVTLK